MQDLKPDPRTYQIVQDMIDETFRLQSTNLTKGSVKADQRDLQDMVQTAELIMLLKEIRDELRILSAKEKRALFPMSIFNR